MTMYNGKATKKRGLIALFIVLTLMMSILGAASLSVVLQKTGIITSEMRVKLNVPL